MLEFSFFEVFLCCAESQAESTSERDNSHEHERRAQTWFFRTCVRSKDGKTFLDLLSLECTQKAAGHLSRYCIRDHMGVCRYCWTQVTKFELRVYAFSGLRNLNVLRQLACFSVFVQSHRLYCTLVSLEIEFCICDEASFGFSACEPSFIFTASNVSDGRCISFSTTCVTNNAKFVSFEI